MDCRLYRNKVWIGTIWTETYLIAEAQQNDDPAENWFSTYATYWIKSTLQSANRMQSIRNTLRNPDRQSRKITNSLAYSGNTASCRHAEMKTILNLSTSQH
jgi:DNA-directed RNA polymerase sigma subunit (sigma70/sigma32)